MIRAAGVLYIADGRALFLKRALSSDHGGEWCLPGGGVEGDETAEEAARREFEEETGGKLDGDLKLLSRRIKYDPPSVPGTAPLDVQAQGEPVDFTCFLATGPAFEPKLNAEHTGFAWAPFNDPPDPLHPGCRVSINCLSGNELDIARMIAAGDLVSPQKYHNIWLFDLRISGTGVAYRPKLDEYVLRKPDGYLTDTFLARCNGLPIIWQHPPTDILTSEEFSKRVIGTVFVPYIKGDEVWGVGKIFNEDAAQRMQDEQLSTSPGVMAAVMLKGTIEIDNGDSTLIVEGPPTLTDHLAICERGVWDKGGEPQGVRAEAKGDSVMADEHKADAGNQGELLDKVLKGIDSIGRRMDAMEEEMKADKKKRADAEEEHKKADAKKRADAHGFSHRKDDDDDESYKKRHDSEEEELKKHHKEAGEAEEVAADKAKKARKDAEEAEEKERDDKAKKDKAKKDAESSAAPGPHDKVPATNTKADSADPDVARRLAQIEDAIKNGMPMAPTHVDHAAMADAQARADDVYQAFGKRAPAPLQMEGVAAYERRLLEPLKKHSVRWKDADLVKIATDSAAFKVVQEQIYEDARADAARPMDLAEGELRMVEKRHPVTKLPIYEFVSAGGTFIGGMKPPAQAHRLNASPRGAARS